MKSNTMTDKQLRRILDEVFFDFEHRHFKNDGVWTRRVNLVFAFADYIESLSDEEIAARLKSNNKKLIARFRFTAGQGIDKWLDENMKTLML